ncbi:hypothetical protein [Maridesulfovibrio sp.]|uniref:hypothetical protein n=1 Tax=Maridesulfovibrio sp. TaxID=2795000 RepID=UPI002AA7E5A4|nr:hypothetical protein [Maridesulfovibrio sp.]
MSGSEIPRSSFEKPSLYLLSLLLNPDGAASGQSIPSDFGTLTFRKMDLLQERGRIPQLVLDYELAGGSFQAVYFGHVSPFKLHRTELKHNGAVVKHVFSEAAGGHIHMETALPPSGLPQGLDWKIVAGSLCLWRACVGLPSGCDKSLGKYFSKMKSVSRYQWTNDRFEIQDSNILETWSSDIPCGEAECINFSIFFANGLIAGISF